MRFQPYTPADRDACLAIFDANTPRSFAPSERADFLRWLEQPAGRYGVLLDEGGSVVGCGGIEIGPGGSVTGLVWAMLAPSHQRRGLGRRLVEERLRWIAAIPEAREIRMDTSQHALGFYEKVGFRVIEYQEDGYGPGLHRFDLSLVVGDEFRRRYGGEAP